MLRWFPRLQVATACFSCCPPDLIFLVTYFIFMYMCNNHCHRVTARPVIEWVPGLFSEVKRPEREVTHTPSSSAEVKNEWSCTSTSSSAFARWRGKSLHMESVCVLNLLFLRDFGVSQQLFPRFRPSGKSLRIYCYTGGRDSSVGIATRYRLDGPGIESRWGRDFPHPSRPALGPTQPPVQWLPGLFRGQSGRGVVLTTHPI